MNSLCSLGWPQNHSNTPALACQVLGLQVCTTTLSFSLFTFASVPITRLKSQKTPKDEVHSMTHEEVCCIPRELLGLSNSYKERTGNRYRNGFEGCGGIMVEET